MLCVSSRTLTFTRRILIIIFRQKFSPTQNITCLCLFSNIFGGKQTCGKQLSTNISIWEGYKLVHRLFVITIFNLFVRYTLHSFSDKNSQQIKMLTLHLILGKQTCVKVNTYSHAVHLPVHVNDVIMLFYFLMFNIFKRVQLLIENACVTAA